MLLAANEGAVSVLEFLIRRVHSTAAEGLLAMLLVEAAQEGRGEVLELLARVLKEPMQHVTTSEAQSTLNAAVTRGHTEFVKRLLADEEGPFRAAFVGDPSTTVFLLESCVTRENAAPELLHALLNAHPEGVARAMLKEAERGRLPNLIEKAFSHHNFHLLDEFMAFLSAEYTEALLHAWLADICVMAHAVAHSNLELCKQLQLMGFAVLRHGNSLEDHKPLEEAIKSGSVEKCKFLLESGEWIGSGDHSLRAGTWVRVAVGHGHVEVCDWLLQYGSPADLTTGCEQRGITPFHIACQHGHLGVAQWLSKHWESPTAHIDDLTEAGNSALHLACRDNHFAVAQFLLDLGTRHVHTRNTMEGFTPVACACAAGSLECVRALYDHGAEADLNYRMTASQLSVFAVAYFNSHFDVCWWLVRKGAHRMDMTLERKVALYDHKSSIFQELRTQCADMVRNSTAHHTFRRGAAQDPSDGASKLASFDSDAYNGVVSLVADFLPLPKDDTERRNVLSFLKFFRAVTLGKHVLPSGSLA